MNLIKDGKKITQVEKILLMPIVCDKHINGIVCRNNVIYSGQAYYSTADEDMSDFAVGFYEIIYKDLLINEKMLDGQGYFMDKSFAGDTMNSFQEIINSNHLEVNVIPHKCEWGEDIWRYYDSYHCLANFWILPMAIGRKSKKKNRFDSMDIFLRMLQSDYNNILLADTWKKLNYETFRKKQFIEHYNIEKVEVLYREGKTSDLIKRAEERIEERAESIAKSDYCIALWNYFFELKLIR